MIILKKLSWDNCFSYGENNEVTLNESTLTQIVGTNGVGKSSIPLIIEEVLFNKNSKGVKKADLPNRYKDGSYKISLELSKNDIEYYIEVLRKGASIKVKLLRNGEDISSHTATNTFKTIQEEIIGIDFKTFSQLVYQNTNASLQFLTATDTARKKFLIDLLGLEDYVAYFETFKELLRVSSSQLTGVESSITTLKNWLETNKLTDTIPLPLDELPEISRKLEDELAALRIELSNISSTNRKISSNNQYKKILAAIDINEVNKIEENEVISYDHLQQQIGHETAVQASAKALIKKMTNLHGVCPTCTQEINESKNSEIIEENSIVVGKCQDQIARTQQEISEIIAKNKRATYKLSKLKEFEDLYRSIDRTLPNELIGEKDLKDKIGILVSNIEASKIAIKTIAENNRKAEKHNTRIQVILEQTDKVLNDLNTYSAKLTILQDKAASLEILKKAFSTNGLLAYKIENLVKELEELTNSYLAELSDGRFTIEFVVLNDKLNVEITDNGNVVDIIALSSGELARVNTATLLAIRKLMSGISKTKINILFLDEVINVLDEVGKEKIVEILIKEEELNTYLVSHGWTHPLLDKISIAKRDEISYLELNG